MRNGRRVARTALITTAAAVAAAVLVPTAAQAGTNATIATVWDRYCNNGIAVEAWFFHYGDQFKVSDACADGHSAQLQVDVEPMAGPNGYDWTYTESGGWGAEHEFQRDYPEGLKISIRACTSEGSRAIACGTWLNGTT
ncbi:hypothetical protein AB0L70_21070 [Kribbella sp. NPDC051952]|uniref:hypothetical protein n=1 Tax=Kribbella sp. NPDC051952 TaxID=3154851 RepID=UPI00344A2FA7